MIQVTASGEIYFGAVGSFYGPAGNGTPAPTDWAFPGISEYSAVVRYNTNPGGWVGTPQPIGSLGACTRYPYEYNVRLVFHMNAPADHTKNTGAWTLNIKIFHV